MVKVSTKLTMTLSLMHSHPKIPFEKLFYANEKKSNAKSRFNLSNRIRSLILQIIPFHPVSCPIQIIKSFKLRLSERFWHGKTFNDTTNEFCFRWNGNHNLYCRVEINFSSFPARGSWINLYHFAFRGRASSWFTLFKIQHRSKFNRKLSGKRMWKIRN